MKLVLVLILGVHGLIHLIGFFKEWNIEVGTSLTGTTVLPLSKSCLRFLGVLWLITAVLCLLTAVLLLLSVYWWWIVGSISISLSQVLVFLYWRDARFGTLANLLILAGILISYFTI